jgi:uncharacterized membrane protein
MNNNSIFKKKFWFKSILAGCLVLVMVLGNAQNALAARTGGRIGGGSFRAPTRTYSPPSGGGYSSPGYGYGYPGGGIGFPFLLPFFGFGGFGGIFSLLILAAVANFLIKSFQNAGVGGEDIGYGNNSQVSVARVQVGLLSNARELQTELNNLALTADTSTASGRATVLQEASLALLRNPEYWVYGAAESLRTNIDAAEAKFNQLSLTERSKFTSETLSNIDNVLRQNDRTLPVNPENGETAIELQTNSGEYIIATIVVGATGKLELPKIHDSDSMRQALQQMGSIGSDRLLAVEVLWTPQAKGDTLSTDDILAYYPNLQLV